MKCLMVFGLLFLITRFMHSGSFDEVVLIYTYATTQDANTGEAIKTWTLLNTVWARVRPSDSGFEGVNAERRENKQRVVFEMRFLPEITLGEKLYFEGNYYNIISKREIDRKMYVRLDTQLTDEIYPTGEATENLLLINDIDFLLINDTDFLII